SKGMTALRQDLRPPSRHLLALRCVLRIDPSPLWRWCGLSLRASSRPARDAIPTRSLHRQLRKLREGEPGGGQQQHLPIAAQLELTENRHSQQLFSGGSQNFPYPFQDVAWA